MAENMVKAGRAGLTFGGDWDSTVEYDRLVGVRYDNKLFFSKKTVPVGTIPEDGEYWFLAYEGLTDEQWEALLNGTQQVGDSAKLGGKDASEYALHIDGVLTASESILDKAKTLSYGVWQFRFDSHDGTDLPHVGYKYGVATVFVRASTGLSVYLWGSTSAKSIAVNHWNGTSWSGWETDAKTSDLANYLPLSGGEVKSNTNNTPFTVNCPPASQVFMGFSGNGGSLGLLGFVGADNPSFRSTDGKYLSLLHTGNKPGGTYNGNGETARTIDVGKPLAGSLLHVCCPNLKRHFIIGGYGGITWTGGGSFNSFGQDVAEIYGNLYELKINNDTYGLNHSGQDYRYSWL